MKLFALSAVRFNLFESIDKFSLMPCCHVFPIYHRIHVTYPMEKEIRILPMIAASDLSVILFASAKWRVLFVVVVIHSSYLNYAYRTAMFSSCANNNAIFCSSFCILSIIDLSIA